MKYYHKLIQVTNVLTPSLIHPYTCSSYSSVLRKHYYTVPCVRVITMIQSTAKIFIIRIMIKNTLAVIFQERSFKNIFIPSYTRI